MRGGAKKSIVWEHLKKSKDGKFAICTICDKSLTYWGNTTNLKQHLVRIHPTVLTKNEPADENMSNSINYNPGPSGVSKNKRIIQENSQSPLKRQRDKKSIVWEHFTKSTDGKLTICTICDKSFKYWGNTTNLKQHLVRIHPIVLAKNEPPNENTPNSMNNNPGSSGLSKNKRIVHQDQENSQPPPKRSKQLKFDDALGNESNKTMANSLDKLSASIMTLSEANIKLAESNELIANALKMQAEAIMKSTVNTQELILV